MKNEEAKNSKINDEISKKDKKDIKKDDYWEFLNEPSEEDIKIYTDISSEELPQNQPSEMFFEFTKEKMKQARRKQATIAGVNDLFKQFIEKDYFPHRFFSNFLKYSTSVFDWIINSTLSFIKLFFVKKTSETESTKKDEIMIKSSTQKEEKVKLTEDKKDKGKKVVKLDKVRIKTLAFLSGRMFTAGSTRTILTILGISISIGVILFLISFGYGLQRTILQKITTEDALLSLVATLPDNAPINNGLLEEIKNIKEVEKVSPLVEYNGSVEIDNLKVDSTIFIVNKDYFSLAGIMSAKGKPLRMENGKIVVSSAMAILLGLDKESVIGTSISLSPTFRASVEGGILEEDETELLTNGEKKSFIIKDVVDDELTVFAYVLDNEFENINLDQFVEAKVKVHNRNELAAVKEKLLEKGYIISSISDTVEESRKIFRGIQIVLGFFGLIALTISAIGMLNILTIVLLERTQEIGIMKAIGASSADIWKIVISDAIIIGFLGGVGGSLIGVSTSKLFNFAFSLLAKKMGGQPLEIFQTPPGFIMIIVSFSAIIGFITGVWPAIRASRISPLEAIRYK